MLTQTQQLSVAELSALYDRVYNIADRLIKKHNPCKIHTKKGKLYCAFHNERWNAKLYLCCSGCIERFDNKGSHWSENGCTTKCLPCKLYLCHYVKCRDKRLSNHLYRLEKFARKYGLPCCSYYISKEDWLKQMKE